MSHRRKLQDKKHFRRLVRESGNTYRSHHVWWDGVKWIRISYGAKWVKDKANRAVRRNKNELYNRGLYKKVYDYWWAVL